MSTRKSNGDSVLERRILGEELTFGKAVEALRVGEEISQAKFARKLKVSPQYLCDVEKGRRFVTPLQAAKFAKAFGHPSQVLVELALQDAIRESGLKFKVHLRAI